MSNTVLDKLKSQFEYIYKMFFVKQEIYSFSTMYSLTLLRRLDCMLSSTKIDMQKFYQDNKEKLSDEELNSALTKISDCKFYNISGLDMSDIARSLEDTFIKLRFYVDGFDQKVKDILYNFDFNHQMDELNSKRLLSQILFELKDIDLSVETVSVEDFWKVFCIISEVTSSYQNGFAGEYSTPQSVSDIISSFVLGVDANSIASNSKAISIYDPTCGMGGILYTTKNNIKSIIKKEKRNTNIILYGQDVNSEACAISKSLALLSDDDYNKFVIGDTLLEDKFKDHTFDYIVSNFPFNYRGKFIPESIQFDPRYQIGTPNRSDLTMTFVQGIINKMDETNGRACFITTGNALIGGDFGSGENSVRKYLIDNDMLECIVALPAKLFSYTGIITYLWTITKNKSKKREGKVQLIDAREICHKHPTSRFQNILSKKDLSTIEGLYKNFEDNDLSKIIYNNEFGELKLSINQPERDDNGETIFKDGHLVSDNKKYIEEIVPLTVDAESYFDEKILPNIDPESWIDYSKVRLGYRFNFNKFFVKETHEISLSSIVSKLQEAQKNIAKLTDLVNKDNIIKRLPKEESEWNPTKIKYICDVRSGSSIKPSKYVEDGYAYLLQTKDIQNGEIDFDKCKQVSEATYKEKNYVVLESGDLVLSVSGTIGKAAIVRHHNKPIIMASGLLLIKPLDKNECNTEYLKLVFSSSLFSDYVSKTQIGSAARNLSIKNLKEMPLSLPNFEDQERIACLVGHHNDLVMQLDLALRQEHEILGEYRNAILTKVLTNNKN